MRRMMIGLTILVVVVVYTLPGCSDGTKARIEVAKDAAVKKIDSLLGSMDVKRKEIDLSLGSMKEAVNGIAKAKIKAQVKHDQIDAKAQPYREKLAQADASLRKLRDHLTAAEPVEIGGKNYTTDELKKMADQIIETRKGYSTQIAGFEQSQAELKKVIIMLEKNQREYQSQVSRLEGQIAQIDVQMVAVRAMKDASASMGDGNATLAQNVAKLEDKVADLLADTKVELAIEGEKWDAGRTERQINSAESFITATQAPRDTIAEIDRILSGQK